MPLPQMSAGVYLECGDADTYSKILLVSENTCVVKIGFAAGEIIKLDEWYYINNITPENARITTRHDEITKDSDEVAPSPQTLVATKRSIYNNITDIRSIGSNDSQEKLNVGQQQQNPVTIPEAKHEKTLCEKIMCTPFTNGKKEEKN